MTASVGQRLGPGSTRTTAGRTVTEADTLRYAGLSGNFNPLHTDAQFAERGPFGRRIAHGPCTQAVIAGLLASLRLVDGAVMTLVEQWWRFEAPVFLGDTVSARVTVADPGPAGGDAAIALDIEVVNQDGKVVQRGRWVQRVIPVAARTGAR